MAVYTKISLDELKELLFNYDIGELESFSAIESGIENTNYFIYTKKDKFVLTIYEKRVNTNELPFFLNLMNHLADKGFVCPIPIANKNGETLSKIKEKSCAIISFLDGAETKEVTIENITEVGTGLARMHIAGNDFTSYRKNDFSVEGWKRIFATVKNRADELIPGLAKEIANNIDFLSANWPKNLPSGIIHVDVFPDNVFFKDNKLAGFIDFYFACNDFLMYDLAICMNSWCFEKDYEFNPVKAKTLFSAYNKVRKISEDEFEALPILARGAALRFLLTRLYDWLNRVDGALVTTKNPLEYVSKMRFHFYNAVIVK